MFLSFADAIVALQAQKQSRIFRLRSDQKCAPGYAQDERFVLAR
jgi:hypothetical protein